MLDRRICIAPMMDWTDRHDRYFLRLIAPHALLYTEMITANALIHGDVERHLAFHPTEHPVALQLGGSDPQQLAKCAKLGESFGYDEINLNVGCPSDRVKSGQFGACLMLEPQLVADCINAMTSAVKIPVTIKCRIGVDHRDSYEDLKHFVEITHQAGCQVFIIHARKAWLQGLSPKQNREIPPLQYNMVEQIKRNFPQLTIVVNGGIKTITEIDSHLSYADGVMIGREAYSNPYLLADIENHYYPSKKSLSRFGVIEQFIPYMAEQLTIGVRLSSMTRHILGLFQGQKGARIWRRSLSESAHKVGAGIDVVLKALESVSLANNEEL